MRWRGDLIAYAALVCAGIWATWVWVAAPPTAIAFDIYWYYLPNMLYAAERVRDGGTGLLWNPFQNCGQPFLGISSTGFLYPANLLFLILPPLQALRAVTIFNFTVAGLGMYALARELGAGRAAALCGALAFQLGSATIDLSTWGPQMSGPYVWMPVALLFCERLLRAPALGAALGLALALTLPLLPGFPQGVFFTYQVVALRVLYELATGRVARPWSTVAAVALGLAVAPLLDAIQLLPSIEMTAQSVRGVGLSAREISPEVHLTWAAFRDVLNLRGTMSNPIVVVPCVVAAASWLRAATRRRAVFYTVVGVLYFVLALGPSTPLFNLYVMLPLGSLFRAPERFLWVTSFCLAVLTALGADAILRRPYAGAAWRRWSPVALTLAALAVLYVLIPDHLYPVEWVLGGMVVAAAALAAISPIWRRAAALLVVAAPALGLMLFPSTLLPLAWRDFATRELPPRRLLRNETILSTRADVFDDVRKRATPQERTFLVHHHPGFTLMPKSASIFQVPAVQDYEPQPSRRSAAYGFMLQNGVPLTSLNQYYYVGPSGFSPKFRHRLLDLAAARFVVIDAQLDNAAAMVSPPLALVSASPDRDVRIYENQQALPRARFVASTIVVPDAERLLHRLAFGDDDLSQVALLEVAPPSGFAGEAGPPRQGTAEIVADAPEHVTVRVHAPTRGFLVLADQYFAGWQVTVNGASAPIMRANYLFRAVEVPPGESTVEFRYTPASVRIGAAITGGVLLGLMLIGLLRWRGRTRQRAGVLSPASARR